MATDESNSLNTTSSSLPRESAANESFVKKVSSRVSGILPSISKWFSREENKSTIRYRDEDDDDDEDQSFRIQPPSKKLKLPPATEPSFKYNNFTLSSISTPMVVESRPATSRQEQFAEPIAGPSGVKSRKLMLSGSREHSVRKDMVNGDNNSDSGDSTSGYSSMARIGSKEQIGQQVEKPKPNLGDAGESLLFNSTSSPRSEENTRSLFHERSFTPRSNSSLSSRRPSFSASNFGSPTFIDRTISTQRILNSPFYNGRTIYGGASAYGRKLGRSSSELRSNLNSSVEVKPKNGGSNESMVLSKTARRILDTLEQYTTPVNDAKKIPVVARRHVRQEGLLSKFTGANPYARDNKVASNTELHVPTVPELLKMKQQLQESTEAVRQIATNSKSNLNKEEYKLPVVVEEEAAAKHTNKIKTKVCAVRQKTNQVTSDATVEAVKLPAVALPISTLPKFDFSVPPPTTFPTTPKEPTQENKTETKLTPKANPTFEFKFSDPIVITENVDGIIGVNNFKFSEPLAKKQLKNNFKVNDTIEFKPKRVQKNNGEIQPAAQLVSGSVMDILGKFKPQEGTWECQSCLVRNQPDKTKCVACESAKAAPSQPTTNLLEKFKPQAGTWECQSCLVRNQPDKTKCVACESAKAAPSQPTTTNLLQKFKPAEGTWECSVCMVRNQPDKTKCVACEAAAPSTNKNQSLVEKFKPAEGTWECPICMIRNKPDVTRCVACESPRTAPPPKPQTQPTLPPTTPLKMADEQWQCTKCKANNKKDTTTCVSCKVARFSFGFGEQFKPTKETWECTSCMVRNQKNAEKCVACESLNPDIEKKFNSGFGEQFKKKASEWECESCMVKNAADKTKCVCCETPKPGADRLDDKKCGYTKFSFGVDKQATSKFTFGIQPTASQQPQQNTSTSFVFGDTSKPAVSTAPATFSFGITPKAATTQAESKETPKNQPLTFVIAPIKPKETETTLPTPEKPNTESPKPITATPPLLPSVPSNLFSTTKPESTSIKPVFQLSTPETKPSPSNTTFTTPLSTQPPSKPFSFGGVGTTASSTSSSKRESSDEAAPPAKMPMFSFGQKTDEKPKENAVAVTQPSGTTVGSFSFGAAENKVPTFQFSAPTTVSAPQPTQNGFSFGGSTMNSAASGFSFGKAAAPATGVFSFGSNSSTQQPAAGTSGGFNFSATAPPAFNPDIQPTFNFTSGTPISFSAQASTNGTALPQRKYKRALRRSNR